ncbi:MAG: glutamate synthase large subunit [candidate division FCPU426 bacterium]
MKKKLSDFTDFKGLNAAGFAPKQGLYDPQYERDSCGIGLIAHLDNQPRHELVENAVKILVNLEHRGAVGGDKATGDGAGLLLQMPDAFFRQESAKLKINLPPAGRYGVAMCFLPTEPALNRRCREALERTAQDEGLAVLGWRSVPVAADHLGEFSRATRPDIAQLFVAWNGGAKDAQPDALERKLYIVRRLAEKEVAGWSDADFSQFYLPSFSCRTIVYKGMLTGTQLLTFYLDLHEPVFQAAFALVHQRYSTNTLPTWSLAQPFRYLAHNGEINTLRGNVNRMRAREAQMVSELFGADLDKLKPVIVEGGSDSAMLDNALELVVAGGRSLPHALMMMIPEAWGAKYHMSEDKRAFYEFHSAFMEPWDGPAAVVVTDGRYIGGVLDRNGLRPCRYSVTKDGLIVMASETGVLEFPPDQIRQKGRLQPGKMFLVDLAEHRIVPDPEIKARIARQQPYRKWVKENRLQLRGLFEPAENPALDPDRLLRYQHAFGYNEEELKMVLAPMAGNSQEAVGSMGNDAALAVLSSRPQLLFHYFKQLFAQVTNPPIDPLREELVMSLMSFVGRQQNLLAETPQHCRQLKLHQPVLTPEDLERIRRNPRSELKTVDLDILFSPGGGGKGLERALDELFARAEAAIADGASLLVLTDRNLDAQRAPIPSLLAVSGLHHHLIRRGLRTLAGILVETGEAREVIHFALLSAFGANAVCPYAAFATVHDLAERRLLDRSLTPEEAMDAYVTAVKKGLLKTFSRMGISTIRSFFGSQIFEAVGLSSQLVERYFTNTASRVEGIGLEEIAAETAARHAAAFPPAGAPSSVLDVGGQYHLREGGEKHLWTPESICQFQTAVRNDDYQAFKAYSRLIDDQSRERATLRSLIGLKPGQPVPLAEVEPVEAITRRFVTAAMSFGSISKEAHEDIAVALNRVGGRSNSGEGGEDPARFKPLPNGDSKRSATKQVASGRFGVTTQYLVNADELQIKMAQGAKPGEGGQLPGHKVSEEIARVRHTTPGVTLISPPPHHDIYSIEDLAQLIYDLKIVNPEARVSVKLVSEVGVGTIAAGVAKAKADMVLISGYDGGTGASPLTAIKHTGLPWELGLSETQQALVGNQLRDRIRVQVDGQLKTGRDLAIAALMGAEEFGFGTTALVAVGCIMMRKCHLNNCPVGVATQDPVLRARYAGKPEYVVRFLRFIAQELREYMAQLGFRTLEEMIGRSDLLEFKPAVDHYKAKGLDYTSLLAPAKGENRRCTRTQDHALDRAFDRELIKHAQPALERREKVEVSLPIRNVHRTAGAMLSGEIVKRHGVQGLPEGTLRFRFTGSAGQSFGAFLAPGVEFLVEGDANDYLGKGMSGGRIVIKPRAGSAFVPEENIIAGNVILYGATGGEVFLRGLAGERFCVRNSGAVAVVEGVGDHGCEYMTGGCVVVIGPTGVNFAAGMSGGVAYVYDESELFDTRCNLDMVDLESVKSAKDQQRLRALLEAHVRHTDSARAKAILDNWETRLPLFVKVMPIDYKRVLERMGQREFADTETVSATEEVYAEVKK